MVTALAVGIRAQLLGVDGIVRPDATAAGPGDDAQMEAAGARDRVGPAGLPPVGDAEFPEQVAGAREVLRADGYDLVVVAGSVAEGQLTFKVVAGGDACEDCLVPKHIFEGVLDDALRGCGVRATVLYPGASDLRVA